MKIIDYLRTRGATTPRAQYKYMTKFCFCQGEKMANSFKFEIDFDASNVRALVIAPKNGAYKLNYQKL
ncbi:MAG: hypothetical protein RSD04_04585 [Clostridia bacterium]